MTRKALISLGLTLVVLATPALARPIPGDAEATLKSGRPWVTVTPSGEAVAILGAVEIAAPPAKVWAILVDCAQTKRIIANMTVCRVVQKTANFEIREQVTKGNAFVPDLRNVFRADYTPYSRITFHKTGGDLKVMQGEWRLEPLDGGKTTRVIYENRVQADIKMPAAMIRAGLKQDCGKVLANLKRVVMGG
jgi:uncharacterized protein YndB with AHSA1/START domain